MINLMDNFQFWFRYKHQMFLCLFRQKTIVNKATIQTLSNDKDTVLLNCFMLLEIILRAKYKKN